MKVRHAGTGFMMIKRELFKRLSGSTKSIEQARSKMLRIITLSQLRKCFLTLVLTIQEHCYRKIIIFAKHGMLWEEVFIDPAIKLKHIGAHVFEVRFYR